ncbi:PTS sugar transporter subunit IIA [Thermosulfurimonas sp. F29]|uniref:PTS sugar transporter subunit IIA n=1 Tax=Thermosulfurimonas sp. F29 TaxID=2867247 RepID=UPI001C837A7F|nr:PTS sugar transporter subunit IIA [Thermosulfurimonas sp. F29]MBX6423131.1 PTS sugar transporter subunit IIA [Thermosulfurimonas sp. F29]
MRLSNLLSERVIILDLSAEDKWAFFRTVSRILAEESGLKARRIEEALCERERLGSTALGEGVALPHARVPLLPRLYVSLARSLKGLEFDSPDGKPVKIIFTVLAPEEESALYLRCLSHLARLLREKDFREGLLSARSFQEILKVVRRFDREF